MNWGPFFNVFADSANCRSTSFSSCTRNLAIQILCNSARDRLRRIGTATWDYDRASTGLRRFVDSDNHVHNLRLLNEQLFRSIGSSNV
eukprot:scaffold15305_cov126-Cylindrotheca_fusiformis.AAC.4